ncbi:MAG TPA: SIR2 family protein [Xanthobacteraceae bacterium]|nr:SIR2 family protein [Xanthobacteraceae bacterium]
MLPIHNIKQRHAFPPRDSGEGGPHEVRWAGRGPRRSSCDDNEALSQSPPPPCFAWSPSPTVVGADYDRLASKLTDGDVLITLNYDTLLDSALHRRGWNPKTGYGIEGNTQKKVKWDPQETDAPLDVQLLKLHGSMNWFVRGTDSKLQKVFESKPVKITAPRSNNISGFIRQIVPPMYGKVFEHDHWRQLWTKSFQALCDAEVLVVIGSSLIDTDFHLRALMSQVARTRKEQSNKFSYLCLVDRTGVRNNWQRILRGSHSRLVTDKTFDKFLHSRLKA